MYYNILIILDDSFCNTFVYRLFIDEIILVDNKKKKGKI